MRYAWYLTAIALFLASTSCGDDGGPDLHGPLTFAGTLDGVAWRPDTSIAIVSGSTCDTTTVISAVRQVTESEEEAVTLILQRFPAAGQATLADTSTAAFATFSVSQVSAGVITSTVTYWTRSLNPGWLTIAGATRTDSLVTGTFAFDAVTMPDTAPHRRLTGRFRVRYSFQPVYTVPGC
jgi:hypothetical protein